MKKPTILFLICLFIVSMSNAQDDVDQFNVDQLVNNVPEIYFKSGKSKLTKAAKEKLDAFTIELLQNTNVRLRIYGRTDPDGSADGNLILSDKRVKSVLDYLMKKGIPRNRMVPKAMGEVSIENLESLTQKDKNELYAHCNRVDFKLFMFMGF